MNKPKKTSTKQKPNSSPDKKAVSHRKNTSGSTRHADRQRSGNNDPQRGSH